ncbi:hypothetical protein [Halorientalis halophila]|uniref:hypothetical protein n=1 Tax=Halorientalis halophila TaxID=3108499 RepID=UPI0030094693
MRTPYETGGYDLVVQVSEREFNDQLAALYAAGSSQFPHQVRQTFSLLSSTGTVNFLFDTPWLHLGTDPQHRRAVSRYDWRVADDSLSVAEPEQLTLFLPFSEASLDIESGMSAADVDGCVMVQHPISVWSPRGQSDRRQVGLDFDAGVERIEVGFTPQTVTRLETENALLPSLLRGKLQGEVATLLERDVGRVELAPDAIAVADDDDPLTPATVEPILLRSGVRGLALALPTQPDTTGDPDAFGAPSADASEPVVALLDADTLLAEIVRPALAGGLGVSPNAFDRPCRLNRSVDLDTSGISELDDLDLRTLRARIDGDHVRVDGTFDGEGSAKGFPFTVEGSFRVRIYLELDDGDLAVRVEADDPEVDIDFPAWVYVVATGIGVLTGGIGGAAIGATLVLIVELLVDALSDPMSGGALAAQFGTDGLDVPLGPAASGLTLSAVELTTDALAIGGRPVTDSGAPVAARSGERTITSGTAVDLDTGDVGAVSDVAEADLAWTTGPQGAGVYARSGAIFAPLAGQAYRSLSVVDLEQAEFEGSSHPTMLPAALVPRPGWLWGGIGPRLVFAVRTSENRYAKCRVGRRADGRLTLEYVTYDRPTPGVEPVVLSSIREREYLESGTDSWPHVTCAGGFGFNGRRFGGGVHTESRSGEYTIDEVSREITATTRTSLLAHPIRSVEWSLDGHVLAGSGTVIVGDGHEVEYAVRDDGLELVTELGKELAEPLSVTVVDDRGLTVTGREWLRFDGVEKEGGRSPEDLAAAREAIDHCLLARRDDVFGPGGVQPDPLPPWADRLDRLAGGQTLPDPGTILPAEDEAAHFGRNDGFALGETDARLAALSLDQSAVDRALRRGLDGSERIDRL